MVSEPASPLVWDCDTCCKVEPCVPAGEDAATYGECAVGDHEPCIYCDGVAYVRRKDAPHGRPRKGLSQ